MEETTLTPGYTLGMRLGYVRKQLGMTKTDMAKSVNVTNSTWSNYENDRTIPRKSTIDLFCRTYHVKSKWLIDNEGEIFYGSEEIKEELQTERKIRDFVINKLTTGENGISREEAEKLFDRTRTKHKDMGPEEFALFLILQQMMK